LCSSHRIHFIGIAGTGMSALAYIFAEKGYEVSGSDVQENLSTIRLRSKGVKIYKGHRPENIDNAEIVVVSSAIPPDNEELIAAKSKNIPILHRGELLGLLTKEKKSIIVAGAHGKTTTTSMVALVLENNNLDPTILVGGEVEDIGGNAKLGKGEFLIAEGDESDGSILKLSPHFLIVTNIDNDHLDYYKDISNIKNTFLQVIEKIPPEGEVLLCSESENIRDILPHIKRPYYTYGFSDAHFTAKIVDLTSNSSEYIVYYKDKEIGREKLKIPGKHNVLNSLSALATAKILGIDLEPAINALGKFNGVQRRLQSKGRIEKNILIFDDYGHHPTEIRCTLQTLKLYDRRLVVAFQPHRYTRTYFLIEELVDALSLSDVLILTEIYSAGEKPIPGVSGKKIHDIIKEKYPHIEVYFAEDIAGVASKASEVLKEGDLFLTLGAGDIWKVGEALLSTYSRENEVEYNQ